MNAAAHFSLGVAILAGSFWLPENATELAVEGTTFVLQQDGHTLRSSEMLGAEIDIGGQMKLRIESVRIDPADPEIVLHQFSIQDKNGAWSNPCIADPMGREEGFPLSGRWQGSNGLYPDNQYFVLTCTSGAQAKCVRFGYKPWKTAETGQSLKSLFESCVRMLRADYCGDGKPMTRDGMAVAIYDEDHPQKTASPEPGLAFEAGWTPEGAVCVHHTRVPEIVGLDELVKRCPRLRGSVGPICDQAKARREGAILYNMSRDKGGNAQAIRER